MALAPIGPTLFLLLALNHYSAFSQTMDEIIAGSYEDVEEFDLLADISGNVIRHELDMLLTREQAEALKTLSNTEDQKSDPSHFRARRKAIRSLSYRWTDKVIPYSIASDTFTAQDKNQIDLALEEWQRYTCVRFRPANSRDNNKIHFDNGKGCYSYVGMTQSGSQKVGLAKGCRFKGVIVHEVGHAVGFHHEQNRPDRDDHVRIIEQNIPKNLRYNFQKYPSSAVDTMGVPYDYSSVMHYGGYAFSSNGQMTIRTLDADKQSIIGNRKGLSYYDIMLANKMYKCNEHCDQSIRCPAGGFLGKDCACWCKGNPVRKCDSTGTIATTRTPPTTPPNRQCRDVNVRNCPAWARAQYCSINTYVKTYCRKSCGFCTDDRVPTTRPPCRDVKTHCAYWQRKGYCTGSFEFFMRENCAKTCKVCGHVNRGPGVNEGNSACLIGCSLATTLLISLFAVVNTDL